MDIVTHAGIGLIAAAPVLDSYPELALGLVAGSVLPDLDALSRIFGKRAFLRSHQTWSHALPVHAGFSALAGCLAQVLGIEGLMLGAGLFAGLTGHALLDFTNTLGVTLLAPFSRKRFCLEWVFFIDAVVLLLTVITAGVTIGKFGRSGEVPARYAVAFFAALTAYIGAKAMLRMRAGALAPDALSLIPSALCPWRFFGVVDGKTRVRLFQINAVTGVRRTLREQDVFDAAYAESLSKVQEFTLMRELSPAYHVVSTCKTDAGELVLCRDLRTRNFGTSFGDLEVLLDAENRVKRIHFHA
jgi:membrane-bound metal-dependent hydrolase YbcI (DUF457 family)